jgi:hypothetical protein
MRPQVLLPVSLITSAITQLNDTLCAPDSPVRWDWYCE